MRTPKLEKCAVCGAKLKRGEHRACRKCVVAVATMRAVSTLDKGICTGESRAERTTQKGT